MYPEGTLEFRPIIHTSNCKGKEGYRDVIIIPGKISENSGNSKLRFCGECNALQLVHFNI